MKKRVGIVGGGILGRLTSFFLHQKNCEVHLFEQGDSLPKKGCSLTAAGMLSPFCELEYSHPEIARLGVESFELWDQIVSSLGGNIFYEKKGTLVLAHTQDKKELLRLEEIVLKNSPRPDVFKYVKVADYEPAIGFEDGLYFPFEGHIDPTELFIKYNERLLPNLKEIYFDTKVDSLSSHEIKTKEKTFSFDFVIDCRGLEANLADLRGVRGELFLIKAPDVKLNRPVRLMHPRYPLYIVPRKDRHFLVGATSIESTNKEPMTVRSALELLSGAFSIHPGFSEGHIMESRVGLRPCFSNHLPQIHLEKGLIRANGLYRHGYLVSPKMAELIVNYVLEEKIPLGYETFFKEIQ